MKVQRALVSVFEKEGVVELAKELNKSGIEIISSGGTAKLLKENDVPVKEIAEITGFPEMMDGRVKTLHPKIHGGILADRKNKEHMEQTEKNGIELIDLVVVNLYPFEKVIGKEKTELKEAIENIDIGGPTLIRAAAKNYKNVIVVCNPADYKELIEGIKQGNMNEEKRKELALKAFEHVSHYDIVIEKYLREEFKGEEYPKYLNLSFEKIQKLRYGENKHQTASFYKEKENKETNISKYTQLQGKELSYNNILDSNSAFEIIKEFEEPTAVVLKHNNPCGVATRDTIGEAYDIAFAGDSQAAFGGIVAVNRDITKEVAEKIVSSFLEVIIAPGFEKDSLEILAKKPKLRLLEIKDAKFPVKREKHKVYRGVEGGILVQDCDCVTYDKNELKVVSKRKPTEQEMKDLLYSWKVAKYVVSNSVVYVKDSVTVGIGAGQMKRVDSAKLAAMIAEEYKREITGSCMASEAFLPFRDAVDEAAKAGVTAIIQPGGSIRDKEVIDAADEHNIAMVFTGIRHFKH